MSRLRAAASRRAVPARSPSAKSNRSPPPPPPPPSPSPMLPLSSVCGRAHEIKQQTENTHWRRALPALAHSRALLAFPRPAELGRRRSRRLRVAGCLSVCVCVRGCFSGRDRSGARISLAEWRRSGLRGRFRLIGFAGGGGLVVGSRLNRPGEPSFSAGASA